MTSLTRERLIEIESELSKVIKFTEANGLPVIDPGDMLMFSLEHSKELFDILHIAQNAIDPTKPEEVQPKEFSGFRIFYDSSECETDFVVPIRDMNVEQFLAEANRTVKEVWGLEDDYREAGYPFKEEHVLSAYAVFDASLEWEDEKGLYRLGSKDEPGAIECYRISLD